jgi:hypothetical protein
MAIIIEGRPSQQKGQGRFGRKVKSTNGLSRKKPQADVVAELETKEMAKTATNDDEHGVRDNEVTTTIIGAQQLQVRSEELLQDPIKFKDTRIYEDYEDNHFPTAKVKEELGNFFYRKDEVKRMCVVVYLFDTVHNANPDKATWKGKHGI